MTNNLKHAWAVLALLLSLSFPAHASLLKEAPIPGSFGVNIHFLSKDMDEHIALLKEAGFGWVRKDLFWEDIEKAEGVYDFASYDTLINALNNNGIKVVLILDYRNKLYDSNLSPYTNIGRRAFTQFAEAAARRYSHNNIVWEIYNEPNLSFFWTPAANVEHYISLAREVTSSLRKIVPHQAIIAPALAGPTPDPVKEKAYNYLNAVLRDPVAKQWDGISIHPYRVQREPENVLVEIPKLQELFRKNGIKAPVIFSEWGYTTAEKGVDEDTEAAYAVRSFLLASTQHMSFSIWYNWQEWGADTSNNEHKYGIIRNGSVDRNDGDLRKPAFGAIRELGNALAGYTFDNLLNQKDGIFCMRFKKGTTYAYALWSSDKATHSYELALPRGKWQTNPLTSDADMMEVTDNKPVSFDTQPMPLIIKKAP